MTRAGVRLQTSPWLIHLPACGLREFRIVGFPHAGGGASGLNRLFYDLRSEIEVIGIQLPGRENRVLDPVSSSLPDVLNGIVESLAPTLRDDVPVVFFGHSLGALLAFEVARRIRAIRLGVPRALIVSGRIPPHLPPARPPLHGLPDFELLQEVIRLDGIPKEIQTHSEMLSLILPALRADLKLDETYEYSPEQPLDCPLLACGGRDDPVAPLCAMQEWQSYTCSRFAFKAFSGGHFFIYTSSAQFTTELLSFLHSVVRVRE